MALTTASVLSTANLAVVVARKTGYKICRRYQDCGLVGLTDRSRRPYRYVNRLPMAIEKWIVR